MGLLLILFWCAAVVGRRETSNILSDNSRFGAFISRLGRRKFPACAATGTRVQGFDLAYRRNGGYPGKIDKIPGFDGKDREFCPAGGTGRDAASRQRCRPPLLRADRPVVCQPRGV